MFVDASLKVQEQNSDQKLKVLIGSLQTCSCGDPDVCIHVLFVMLKVSFVSDLTARIPVQSVRTVSWYRLGAPRPCDSADRVAKVPNRLRGE